ncbi:MAG: class I SAM-dependent methyltransferase [Chloroflexi bacterium]|nr:MAG: class I SAM-dependent methyltransferase [Chloroflexota bacterium]
MTEKPRVPVEYYTDEYFDSWNYADRGMGRFSMYWFARRYYAALVRRYAPRDGGRLLEMGCGLGHLLGLLQDDYECYGVDLIERSVRESRKNAPKAQVRQGDATDLSMYEDGSFSVVVALHLVEHLPEPDTTIREVARILKTGGIFLFATPHPEYALRRFKDRETDAIGKDKTHINCHVPQVWRNWCEEAGLAMVKHFGDGLWDVPYLPLIPRVVQFAMFGFPAFLQVVTRTTWMPLALGVNQVGIARKR